MEPMSFPHTQASTPQAPPPVKQMPMDGRALVAHWEHRIYQMEHRGDNISEAELREQISAVMHLAMMVQEQLSSVDSKVPSHAPPLTVGTPGASTPRVMPS